MTNPFSVFGVFYIETGATPPSVQFDEIISLTLDETESRRLLQVRLDDDTQTTHNIDEAFRSVIARTVRPPLLKTTLAKLLEKGEISFLV